jgi:hypothetical protein
MIEENAVAARDDSTDAFDRARAALLDHSPKDEILARYQAAGGKVFAPTGRSLRRCKTNGRSKGWHVCRSGAALCWIEQQPSTSKCRAMDSDRRIRIFPNIDSAKSVEDKLKAHFENSYTSLGGEYFLAGLEKAGNSVLKLVAPRRAGR